MFLSNLSDDILDYISTLINIECHVCYKKFDYKIIFIKNKVNFIIVVKNVIYLFNIYH